MKVILLSDIHKVGKKDDVREFADGYAQNVLISKGLAIFASAHELQKLEERKKKSNRIKEEEAKTFSELISAVNQKPIILKLKTNGKGHLFFAVPKKDVVKAIKDTTGANIEEEFIIFPKPIKEIGSHHIEIKKGGNTGKCIVTVEEA